MALFDRKKKTEDETQHQPTNEEQMMRRQSAPHPTVQDEMARMVAQRGVQGASLMSLTAASISAISA